MKLKTGGDDNKVAIDFNCDIVFNQFYPYNMPKLSFWIKGVDDDQKEQIDNKITKYMKELINERRDMEDDSGFLYQLYENISEILTKFNDTCRGRCAVCLELFSLLEPPDTVDEGEEESAEEIEKFTEREDLVRIDTCYHRFHLICLYRDWYMKR